MDNPFENLSDEQLLAMIREAGRDPNAAPSKETPKPEKVSVRLGDGSVLEAESPEELNKLLVARIGGPHVQNEPQAPAPAPAPANQPVSWDMKTFVDKFSQDPAGGLEYLEVAKYGMPVGRAVPQLLGAILGLAAKVQELETAQFAPQKPEERQAIERIMKERNWQPSRQSFEDARDIAKARGFLTSEEKKPEERREPTSTFIPPRVPRASGEEAPSTVEEIVRQANEMPLEQLEELLFKSGHIKARRT